MSPEIILASGPTWFCLIVLGSGDREGWKRGKTSYNLEELVNSWPMEARHGRKGMTLGKKGERLRNTGGTRTCTHSPSRGKAAQNNFFSAPEVGNPATWLQVILATCEARSFYLVSGQSEMATCFSSTRKWALPASSRAGSWRDSTQECPPSCARFREPEANTRGCRAVLGWSW